MKRRMQKLADSPSASKHEVSAARVKENKKPAGDRWWNQDVFIGTGVVYAAYPLEIGEEVGITVGDYDIDLGRETSKDQLRYARRSQSLSPAGLPDALQDEVFVVFGPDVSPRDAIKALRRIIERIKSDGLLTGENDRRDLVWERTDGSKTS